MSDGQMSDETTLELLVEVLTPTPLRLHVSLHQPEGSDGVAWVPRLLRPVGAFVRVVVRDAGGEPVLEAHQPKFKPKLKPDRDDSYVPLDPGYSFGTVLDLDTGPLRGGTYGVEVTYSNLDYEGTADRPVGTVALRREVELRLGG